WDKAIKKRLVLASTYLHTPQPKHYCQRWGVSRLCSGREELVPPRSRDQDTTFFKNRDNSLKSEEQWCQYRFWPYIHQAKNVQLTLSTARLSLSLDVHQQPINVVVSYGSNGDTSS